MFTRLDRGLTDIKFMDQCEICPIRQGCDWLSEVCRLSPRQLIRQRPDLISRDRRQYWRDRYQASKQPLIELDAKINEYIATGAHEDFVHGGYKTWLTT